MFIDSHAHLTSTQIFPFIDDVVQRALNNGIESFVNICTDSLSLQRGLALREKYPEIYNAAATTPHDVATEGTSFFPEVKEAASQKLLVAIGEIGLDYYYEHSDRKIQKEFLSRYFELAAQVNLPVIFHCREAFDDLFSMADQEFKDKRAVLHCFTGSVKEAKEVLDRGWFISFSGIITYKKSEELREVVKFVPLDRIFIETDSPYLAPNSKRGKQNEPSFIKEIADSIAFIKNEPLLKVAEVTTKNIRSFFSF
ncbi:MAG: TatD family deoxyribonuclease [Chlamydiae bacterium]|nr:TatD family deoxyribonuclease [Chlamydiota bacterium]